MPRPHPVVRNQDLFFSANQKIRLGADLKDFIKEFGSPEKESSHLSNGDRLDIWFDRPIRYAQTNKSGKVVGFELHLDIDYFPRTLDTVIAREDDTPPVVSAELGEAFKVTPRDDPNGDLYHYRLQKSMLIAKFIYYNPPLNWGPKKLTSIRFYFENSGFDSAGMQF